MNLCPTANKLRRDWYAAAVDSIWMRVIDENRKSDDYKKCKRIYIDHVQSCEECQSILLAAAEKLGVNLFEER